jgi:diguanylate cyclase (GGDEF)-like protein
MNRQFYEVTKGNILVVDDRQENLHCLAMMLANDGYEVRKVRTGKMALVAAQAKLPDLILLDIIMPEMDGYQVCRQLKSNPQTEDIPIIFLSALDRPEDKILGFEAGGADYITKPFQILEVLARVKNQLTLKKLQQQLIEQNEKLQREIGDRVRAEIALKKANQELQRLAILDGLTQLANRQRFEEYLQEQWEQLGIRQGPLSVILVDVDDFKAYNDAYGHLAGDECLRKIAGAIAIASNRRADLVARYGGEEFAAILPQTPLSGALEVADAILRDIEQLNLTHEQSSVSTRVTVSLGVATGIPRSEVDPHVLVSEADAALYEAKRTGRNRYCIGRYSYGKNDEKSA